MPNHMHMILEQLSRNGKESPVASFKKYTSHEFEKYLKKNDSEKLKSFTVDWKSRKVNFWQPHPDEFELYYEKTILQKLEYIHNNPLQKHWNLAKRPIDYEYSSARFYETGEKNFAFLYDYKDWRPSESICLRAS
jgi:REP element-mobilizing transposase RayT